MPMYAFDTLKTAKTLAEAGFNAKQADAVAGALRDAVTENTATKSDMYRALLLMFGAIILANATIAVPAFALAGYIAGP